MCEKASFCCEQKPRLGEQEYPGARQPSQYPHDQFCRKNIPESSVVESAVMAQDVRGEQSICECILDRIVDHSELCADGLEKALGS